MSFAHPIVRAVLVNQAGKLVLVSGLAAALYLNRDVIPLPNLSLFKAPVKSRSLITTIIDGTSRVLHSKWFWFGTTAVAVGTGYWAYRKWITSAAYKLMMGNPIIRTTPPVETGKEKQITMESTRDGSLETPQTIPKYQCRIGRIGDDKKFIPIGCAVRFDDNYLVSPDHVVTEEEDVEKYAYGTQGMVSLKGKERHFLAADVMGIKMTDKEVASIGVATCNVGSIPFYGAMATIVGSRGFGTTSGIRDDPQYFGRVIYDGSTAPGYSGSAYMSGNHVIGLHLNGGRVNGGISASFVKVCLKMLVKEQPESFLWLQGLYKNGKEIAWNHADPGRVSVRADGAYHLVEVSSMAQAFGSDWDQQRSFKFNAKQRRDYADDYEASSGEAQNSLLPGASNSSPGTSGLAEHDRQSLMKEWTQLSHKQVNQLRKSIQQLSAAVPPTDGPAPM